MCYCYENPYYVGKNPMTAAMMCGSKSVDDV